MRSVHAYPAHRPQRTSEGAMSHNVRGHEPQCADEPSQPGHQAQGEGMPLAGNTAFALLMGLEEDLVTTLRTAVGDGSSPLTVAEFDKASERLSRDRGPTTVVPEWTQLLYYLDLGQKVELVNRVAQAITRSFGLRLADVRSVTAAVAPLVPIRNRVCHARPLEPEDYPTVVATVSQLLTESAFPFAELARVYQTLRSASNDYPFTLQIPAFWREGAQQLQHNLPIPDFEDTGFVGRDQDRRNLGQLLAGAYPVINVTGEGGLGKTSLALRCLYDIPDGNGTPYEAIVWTTLKINRLTAAGIQSIVGGLGSEIDVLRPVVEMFEPESLASESRDQLYDRLIEIMKVYPLLLAIDNIETIDVDALRPLLIRIPYPSKVLLTSRIGMGDVELRYPLEPLTAGDAVQLLRRVARLMNVEELTRRDDAGLRTICDKLYRNPLLLRWFVEGYTTGRSIPGLLNATGDFKTALKFCFQNVYDRLSDENCTVLGVLSLAPGALSEVEVALLTGIRDIDAVRSSLRYLQSSNLLQRVKDEYGLSADLTMWMVTDLARTYVNSYDPPSTADRRRVSDEYRALLVARDQARPGSIGYAFRSRVLDARSVDEAQVHRILRRAQQAASERDFKAALERVEEARLLQPGFYEVYRVSAQIKTASGDPADAEEDFRAALELADGQSQPLLVFYSQFLRSRGDVDAAIDLLAPFATRSAVAPQLLIEYAWSHVIAGRPQEAVPIFEQVGKRIMELSGAERSVYVTQHARALREIVESYPTSRMDAAAAPLHDAVETIARACPVIAIDREVIAEGQACFQLVCQLLAKTHDMGWWQSVRQSLATMAHFFLLIGSETFGLEQLEARWKQLANSEEFVRIVRPGADSHPAARMNGTLLRIPGGRDYGFIRGADGNDYFVYRTALRTRVEWEQLWSCDPMPVTFAPGDRVAGSSRAPKALDVALVELPSETQ
jgi:LuxR family transcriptional regulator, glucitol operon activator